MPHSAKVSPLWAKFQTCAIFHRTHRNMATENFDNFDDKACGFGFAKAGHGNWNWSQMGHGNWNLPFLYWINFRSHGAFGIIFRSHGGLSDLTAEAKHLIGCHLILKISSQGLKCSTRLKWKQAYGRVNPRMYRSSHFRNHTTGMPIHLGDRMESENVLKFASYKH